jgi:CheY-like chemotaxis protein
MSNGEIKMNIGRLNVLIVDPSSLVTDMLSTLLEETGCITHVAQDGLHALGIMGHNSIDFLCFANELGDMGGIELFVKARTRELLSHQIGCLLTADLRSQILTCAPEEGFLKRVFSMREPLDSSANKVPRSDIHTGKSEFLNHYRGILESLGLTTAVNVVHTAGSMGKKSLTPILAISSFDHTEMSVVATI